MVRAIVRLFMFAALVSCGYGANFEDCMISCTTAGCPDGLTCGPEGLCRSSGKTETCAAVLGTVPSCDDLPATCGPMADSYCCETAPVSGGTFLRSYDTAADGMYTDMSHPATIGAFKFDRFEVTVGRFRAFIEAQKGTQQDPPTPGTGAHTKISGSGWDASWNSALTLDATMLAVALQCDGWYQTWTPERGANEDLPINCVTWYEAMAFCVWDGGYLPTEAEWNYAAAGGAEQRAYPWSSPVSSTAIDCSYANYNPNYPSGPFCTSSGGARRVGSTSPKGDGKWGQSDLGGNINEWVLDWYAAYSTTCDDCANLIATGDRVLRGSDWINAASTIRGAFRNYTIPIGNRDQKVGFRCARPAL